MKKIIKNTLLTILLMPVVLLLLGVITYYIYALLALGGESTLNQSYLNKHKQVIELSSDEPFSLFDSAFYRNQIFMLSEVHGFAVPQELDFMLLRHLNQQTGLRYYLAEVDHSQAYYLNQYLETGNEDFLRYVFQTWIDANAQWGNKNYYNKFKKVYELNKGLPVEKQISIIGVDKIQDIRVTNRFLTEKLHSIQYASGSNTYLDSLQTIASCDTLNTKSYAAFTQRLVTDIQKNEVYSKLLKNEKFEVMHVLQNIGYFAQPARRDSVMYLNLQALTAEYTLQNQKMYGLWGFFHTLPGTVNKGKKPFAAFLQEEGSIFKDKVAALTIFAIDSENMVPTGGMPKWLQRTDSGKPSAQYINTTWVNSNGPLAFVNGIRDLKAVTKENTITMFKLDGKDSPYQSSSSLTQTKVLLPGQTITPDKENPAIEDAFPYAILIRNSAPLEPLE